MTEGVSKKIVYDYEGSTFEIEAKNLSELEEIIDEDHNLKPKTYTVQFVRNGTTFTIKSERHFAGFITADPNQSGDYRITITRTDDKPAKPSTDMYSVPCESMTTHIRDNVDPYW